MKQNLNNTFIIESEDANQRLDTFLSAMYSDLSRSFLQKQIKSGNILLNGLPAKASNILKTDDNISVEINFETHYSILPENIPLEILYDDETMAIINKPKGMLTHPTSLENTGTLVNALLYRFGDKLSDCNGVMRPGIVHRLDRNTSGLLMIAKSNDSYTFLKEKMQKHEVEKKYYAIVCGNMEKDCGSIIANIGRHPSKPEKMAVTPDGKPSVTHYKVLERFGTHTFLEINLETGRTHQIRVHMSYIKHPIVNDTMYGGAKLPVKTSEQVLQAFYLRFTSPLDDKEREIKLDFDNDIIKTLNYLRSKK